MSTFFATYCPGKGVPKNVDEKFKTSAQYEAEIVCGTYVVTGERGAVVRLSKRQFDKHFRK